MVVAQVSSERTANVGRSVYRLQVGMSSRCPEDGRDAPLSDAFPTR